MAKRACLNARVLLPDENQAITASAPQVDTGEIIKQLTEAIDATTHALVCSRDLKHRAIRCRLFTYRAMAFTWAGSLDKALADTKEALQLYGQDAVALKFQAQLREAFASRFKVENPARFVPTCLSQSEYLRRNGHESEMNVAFEDSVDRVRRDRPYPEWFQRRGVFCAPVDRAEPEPEPSRWDFVIHRLEDLIIDEDDRRETRTLLLANVDPLLEIFNYYCLVGSTAQSGNSKQFVRIKAHPINKDTLTLEALRLYNAMFVQDSQTAPLATLLTLRQFWQMARDCAIVDDHCDLADINRIVVLASRESSDDSHVIIGELKRVMAFKRQKDETGDEELAAQIAENQGPEFGPNGEILTGDLSVCDDVNPHHPNNQLHAYEFVEALIRCAAKYHSKKLQKARGAKLKTGRESGTRVADSFRSLLSDHILAHACSHEVVSKDFWMFSSLVMQAMVVDYRTPMEKVFRYFSVANPNTIVSVPGSGVQQFWKVRSKELLDDTMDFNEIYTMLHKFDLFDANLTPRVACKLFTRVTGAYAPASSL